MAFADPYLSKSAVADLLGCSERTLERMVRDNGFPPPLRRSREALWYESVVMRWLEDERDRQLAWEPAKRGREPSDNAVRGARMVGRPTAAAQRSARKTTKPKQAAGQLEDGALGFFDPSTRSDAPPPPLR